MHPLIRRVGAFVRRQRLVSAGDTVAIGVSGGADSVALTWILAELSAGAPWSLAGLVHVHHGLRPEADDDAAFVVGLGARLGLPVEVCRVDVPARMRAARRSLESVAREARYACFADAAPRLGATAVATGHTLDDQAETVLLRLLRGAGTRGVSGVRVRRGSIVRPLLECRRADLRAWLDERGEAFREDASNLDRSVPRNRLRHDLLPIVDAVAPGGVAALGRFAALAADDERVLATLANEAGGGLVHPDGDGVQLQRGVLADLTPAVARRVVRSALERVGGTVTLRDVEAVLGLARSRRVDGRLDLHRVAASVTASRIRLGPPHVAEPRLAFEAVLPVPGRVAVGDTGLTLLASEHRSPAAGPPFGDDPARVVVQAASLHGPLVVRTRRPGDRVHPLGAPGVRKLQDVLVDRKIPRTERDRVPLVVDARGRIVWVAGVVLAHDCRVTAPESGMVILELEKGPL